MFQSFVLVTTSPKNGGSWGDPVQYLRFQALLPFKASPGIQTGNSFLQLYRGRAGLQFANMAQIYLKASSFLG